MEDTNLITENELSFSFLTQQNQYYNNVDVSARHIL